MLAGSAPTTTSGSSRAATATRRPPVLESLARVLGLDRRPPDYLLSLARRRPRGAAQRRPRRETVRPASGSCIAVVDLPAFVEGRLFDVLAANGPTRPRCRRPCRRARTGSARCSSTRPSEALYPDWRTGHRPAGRQLPRLVGPATDDPRIAQLVGELSLSSERFRRLWAAAARRQSRGGMPSRLHHPELGDLSSGARSSPSATPGASCWWSTTPSPAPAAPRRWRSSPPWPARPPRSPATLRWRTSVPSAARTGWGRGIMP